jgi:hypothetical protein
MEKHEGGDENQEVRGHHYMQTETINEKCTTSNKLPAVQMLLSGFNYRFPARTDHLVSKLFFTHFEIYLNYKLNDDLNVLVRSREVEP